MLIVRLRRLPKAAFSSTSEVAVEFDELDPATARAAQRLCPQSRCRRLRPQGLPFEEVFSFAKPHESDRFVREVEDAKQCARGRARLAASPTLAAATHTAAEPTPPTPSPQRLPQEAPGGC